MIKKMVRLYFDTIQNVARGGDVQVQEIRKNDEKRRFRRWISKIPYRTIINESYQECC
jgi:hypothetical protein